MGIQNIENPTGLSVFGSALLRISPDLVSMNFSVLSRKPIPQAAFNDCRETATQVRQFLTNAKIKDVQASRISLEQVWEYKNHRKTNPAFEARISFNLTLRDLNRCEEIVCGAVDAGANHVGKVSFQTSELKRHRAEARRQAVAAANEKAQIYAEASGIQIGPILHIEDVNPQMLRGGEGHMQAAAEPSNDEPGSAFDPGAITIGAAVAMVFSITQKNDRA